MYKFLFTVCLTYFLSSVSGQLLEFNGSEEIDFYKKFLTKNDTPKLNKNDFQIRLWFNNQKNKINTGYLISLSKIKKNWVTTSYKFTVFMSALGYRKHDSAIVQKLNNVQIKSDSLYDEIVKNGLNDLYNINLPDSLNHVPANCLLLHGPRYYSIELISNSKYWVRTYAEPQYFISHYQIYELEIPAKIIKALLTSFHIDPYSL